MNWRIEFRPEVEKDISDAATWYESREPGLGRDFVEEIIAAWVAITAQPLSGSRRLPSLDIRWRYPDHFPYRVIYCVDENAESILVIAVLHAARHDSRWQSRI